MVTIRSATIEDTEFIREALLASTSLAPEDVRRFLASDFVEALGHGDPILIAVEGDNLVGCHVCLVNRRGLHYEANGSTGYCTYVLPDFRKRGVSKLLRAESLEVLKKLGIEYTVGAVSVNNEAGLKSILSEGFEIQSYIVGKKIC